MFGGVAIQRESGWYMFHCINKTYYTTIGQAYSHYKWSTGRGDNAPFWTSQVQCTGNERRLEDCPKVPYGQVKECIKKHYAGALCYQDFGEFKTMYIEI